MNMIIRQIMVFLRRRLEEGMGKFNIMIHNNNRKDLTIVRFKINSNIVEEEEDKKSIDRPIIDLIILFNSNSKNIILFRTDKLIRTILLQ